MPILSASHPLILSKMTRLRDVDTNSNDFRRILKDIAFYLAYEATRNLNIQPDNIITPMKASYIGSKISDKIAIIPILRAGLGMADAVLELIPNASVYHLGKSKKSYTATI